MGLHIPDSWQLGKTVLWVLPGHFASFRWPAAHPQGPGVWLPAWMRTLLVAKGAGNIPPPLLSPPSRLPSSFPQLSSPQMLTCLVRMEFHQTQRGHASQQLVLQPRGMTTVWPPWRRAGVLRLKHETPARQGVVMRQQGRSGPACPGPRALRTCVLSWSNREPWKLSRGCQGQKCIPKSSLSKGGGAPRVPVTGGLAKQEGRARRLGRKLK